MAIPVIQSSAVTPWATGTTLAGTKPSGIQVGDLLVAQLSKQGGFASGGVQFPTGFDFFTGTGFINIPNSGHTMMVVAKIATATEVSASTLDFTFGGDSRQAMCVISRITGHTGLILDRVVQNISDVENTATPSLAAGVSPNGIDGSLIMQFWGAFGDVSAGIGTYAIATSNPTWTEIHDTPDSTTKGLSSAWGSRPEVTATGNVSCAGGSGTTDWCVICVSIPGAITFDITETLTLTESAKQNILILAQETLTLTEELEAEKLMWNNPDKTADPTWLTQTKS